MFPQTIYTTSTAVPTTWHSVSGTNIGVVNIECLSQGCKKQLSYRQWIDGAGYCEECLVKKGLVW